MKLASLDYRTVAWAALYLILFILAGIFTGGLYFQAQYGSANVCLLFVDDYRGQDGSWTFQASSPACGIVIGIGALGLILAFLLGGCALYFLVTGQARAKRVIQAFALVATMFVLVMLVAASVTTAGVNKTCTAIESGAADKSCENTFNKGFYAVDGSNELEAKNLGTVRAAVSAGWLLVLGWGGYAAAEWWNWRVASQRWW
ncbi:hypothetical protein DFJ77DRAFT_455984 [Powellomyces hirtus]|nr:hypothetical protein DFJ77DRAFT_455984 [Powellomyces hirtus]